MEILKDLHAVLWLNPSANNCNTYFINRKKRILIDPGHDHLFTHVRDYLQTLNLSPQDMDIVIVTHGHPDHMEGIRHFIHNASLIALHGEEMEFIRKTAPHYSEILGIPDFEPNPLLQEGDLEIGNLTFRVIHTPGHSPGSICLYWPEEKVLFTGDVVFNQGVGRTDLPGGSGEELKESIRRLARLDVEHLLPGHGGTLSGADLIKTNFSEIERVWFAYL